jgi:hypothetical protein
MEPISNREKRTAHVVDGACRACRDFFDSRQIQALPNRAGSVHLERACRDLEISKTAGYNLCWTILEIDLTRRAEPYRRWTKTFDPEHRLDVREYYIHDSVRFPASPNCLVVCDQWAEKDFTLEYAIYLHVMAAGSMPLEFLQAYVPYYYTGIK